MAYQLGTLIGALGGSQTPTVSTVTRFGQPMNFVKVGNVVQVSCTSKLSSATAGGNVPAGMEPAAPVTFDITKSGQISYARLVIGSGGILSLADEKGDPYSNAYTSSGPFTFCYLCA